MPSDRHLARLRRHMDRLGPSSSFSLPCPDGMGAGIVHHVGEHRHGVAWHVRSSGDALNGQCSTPSSARVFLRKTDCAGITIVTGQMVRSSRVAQNCPLPHSRSTTASASLNLFPKRCGAAGVYRRITTRRNRWWRLSRYHPVLPRRSWFHVRSFQQTANDDGNASHPVVLHKRRHNG